MPGKTHFVRRIRLCARVCVFWLVMFWCEPVKKNQQNTKRWGSCQNVSLNLKFFARISQSTPMQSTCNSPPQKSQQKCVHMNVYFWQKPSFSAGNEEWKPGEKNKIPKNQNNNPLSRAKAVLKQKNNNVPAHSIQNPRGKNGQKYGHVLVKSGSTLVSDFCYHHPPWSLRAVLNETTPSFCTSLSVQNSGLHANKYGFQKNVAGCLSWISNPKCPAPTHWGGRPLTPPGRVFLSVCHPKLVIID